MVHTPYTHLLSMYLYLYSMLFIVQYEYCILNHVPAYVSYKDSCHFRTFCI